MSQRVNVVSVKSQYLALSGFLVFPQVDGMLGVWVDQLWSIVDRLSGELYRVKFIASVAIVIGVLASLVVIYLLIQMKDLRSRLQQLKHRSDSEMDGLRSRIEALESVKKSVTKDTTSDKVEQIVASLDPKPNETNLLSPDHSSTLQDAQPIDDSSGLPHADVAHLLEDLMDEVARLADSFTILGHRREAEKLAESLPRRLDALRSAVPRGRNHVREHWLGQQLVPTLDILALLFSYAVKEGYQGEGVGDRNLEVCLNDWLYRRFRQVCRHEGWFEIEPVLPYETPFDHDYHQSVGSRHCDGVGREIVVEIKAVGYRDLKTGFITRKAQVVVSA